MPYGGDVNIMSNFPNLIFKHAIDKDYPEFYKNLSLVESQVRR